MADKPEKKARYIIMSATDTSVLERQINQRITEGYVPYGNLVVAHEENVSGLVYFQAMLLKSPVAAA